MSKLFLPEYWKQASKELAKKDSKMAAFVKAYKGGTLASRGDPFMTLSRSIVGQQISVKAADSVWARFVSAVGQVTPGHVLACSAESLKKAGLSTRKLEYITDLAKHFSEGKIHSAQWKRMSDEEIITELTAVRGIGVWTAEMFLIFHEMRPDVFPLDDIGLKKAVALHYCEGVRPSRSELARIGEKWRPWRSVAAWYLWRSLDPIAVEY